MKELIFQKELLVKNQINYKNSLFDIIDILKVLLINLSQMFVMDVIT